MGERAYRIGNRSIKIRAHMNLSIDNIQMIRC
jgi:hypothetical protein